MLTTKLDNPNKLLGLVEGNKLKFLHEVNTFKGLFSIVIDWVFIVLCVYLTEKYFNWFFYIASIVIIGSRYLSLGLIMHESVHGSISKNKKLNDFVSELFCAWPLFISMRSYRVKHLTHHQYLNTDKDPDYTSKFDENWRYPMNLSKFIKIMLYQLSGFGVFETFKVMSSSQMEIQKDKTPLWYNLSRISFYFLIIFVFVYLGKGILLFKYWIIPFATWTQVINRLRRVAEHSGLENRHPSMQTRTTKHGVFARFFLAPQNIAFHTEHHLYPKVPCYNLRKLHDELMKHESIQENFYISKSYVSVYKDCVKR